MPYFKEIPSNVIGTKMPSYQWYMDYANKEIVSAHGWYQDPDPIFYWYHVPITFDEFQVRYSGSTIRLNDAVGIKRDPYSNREEHFP